LPGIGVMNAAIPDAAPEMVIARPACRHRGDEALAEPHPVASDSRV
jgi:hypothetical protein